MQEQTNDSAGNHASTDPDQNEITQPVAVTHSVDQVPILTTDDALAKVMPAEEDAATRAAFDEAMTAQRDRLPAQTVFLTPDKDTQNVGLVHATLGGKVMRAQRLQGKTSYQLDIKPGDCVYVMVLEGDAADMFEQANASLTGTKPAEG